MTGIEVGSMRFCDGHWQELRDALKEREIDVFVSKDGLDLADRLLKKQISGDVTLATYDPLSVCHANIVVRVIETIGVFEGCPLCRGAESHDLDCPESATCEVSLAGGVGPYLIKWAADHAREDVDLMLANETPTERPA